MPVRHQISFDALNHTEPWEYSWCKVPGPSRILFVGSKHSLQYAAPLIFPSVFCVEMSPPLEAISEFYFWNNLIYVVHGIFKDAYLPSKFSSLSQGDRSQEPKNPTLSLSFSLVLSRTVTKAYVLITSPFFKIGSYFIYSSFKQNSIFSSLVFNFAKRVKPLDFLNFVEISSKRHCQLVSAAI